MFHSTAAVRNGLTKKTKLSSSRQWSVRKARIGQAAVRLYQREQRACEWHNRNPQTHLARALDRFCDLFEGVRA